MCLRICIMCSFRILFHFLRAQRRPIAVPFQFIFADHQEGSIGLAVVSLYSPYQAPNLAQQPSWQYKPKQQACRSLPRHACACMRTPKLPRTLSSSRPASTFLCHVVDVLFQNIQIIFG